MPEIDAAYAVPRCRGSYCIVDDRCLGNTHVLHEAVSLDAMSG